MIPLVGAEAHWSDLFCGGRVAEKDRPAIRKFNFQGHQVPLPIGIDEEEFRLRIGDWLEQFPTADLIAVFASRTHFTYGYLPVLDEKAEAFSDLDVMVHYPWVENLGTPVNLARSAPRDFKVKCSVITRNAPNISEFVRGRDFQFPKTLEEERSLFRRSELSWWRHWFSDARQRYLDLAFRENPFVSAAERRQRAEGRINLMEPWAVFSVNKEAIIFLPKGPSSAEVEAVLRTAGFIYVFQIERSPCD